jgi:RNA polymerase sigma factor (sigma-70 family)
VEYARNLTSLPEDLVHHTYLRMVDADFFHINDALTTAYFTRAMRNNARTSFKKLYATCELFEMDEEPQEKRIALEMLDEAVRHLDYFDRTIFELYLRGESMKKLSDESGINLNTIYSSLKKIRRTIKDYLVE